jgi:D-galactarolactone cycloisomerase
MRPMRISNVRVLLLSAPIPPERRWTSDFGTNTRQDVAIVVVETDAGLVGYGEAKGTPVVMKVLVEDVLGPQIIGEDPTRVEFVWEKLYSASRLPLALQHGRPYHRAGSRGETIHAISGIDVALWDIYGKSLGLPIYRLLGGGVRERVPAYASGGWAARIGRSTKCSATEPKASAESRSASAVWMSRIFRNARSNACVWRGRRWGRT